MLFHLVYCSTAVRLLDVEALDMLLALSRERNAVEELTGLLLYHRGGFMQVLEGPEEGVRRVFRSIRNDARHHDVTVIFEDRIEAREFSDWHMAFQDTGRKTRRPSGYDEFLNSRWNPLALAARPGKCHDLLLAFREIQRL